MVSQERASSVKAGLLVTLSAVATLFCLPALANAESVQQISGQDAVRIGQQIWMARNLAVRTFRNGDAVEELKQAQAWAAAGRGTRPALSIYANTADNAQRWGLLYNYAAVMDARSLCPLGWRVPDNKDWRTLEETLGGGSGAAVALKAQNGWNGSSNGTNASGFAARPAGFRTQTGAFFLAQRVAYFWSSTRAKSGTTTAHMIFDYPAPLFRIAYDPAMGMSLRCIAE